MSSLQIQILSGPGAGKRAAFSGSPVTFGRDADNALVVAGKFVSRRHGELREEDGQWVLDVQSQNGALLNGRKVRKPTPVRNGDTVIIGDEPIFQIASAVIAAPADTGEQPIGQAPEEAPAAPVQARINRKTKLWIGIGAYLLFMLVMMVFLKTLKNEEDRSIKPAAQLSAAQIEQEIRQPPPPVQPLDERRAREALLRAREKFDQRHAYDAALYQAYRAYQESLRYAGRTTFEEGIDQRRYQDVQSELVGKLTTLYEAGYTQFIDGRFEQAVETFQEIRRRWPDDATTLFRNAGEQVALAKEYARSARRRR